MPDNTVDMKEIFNKLDDVLGKVDLSSTTAESSGFADLEPGYYLTAVESAELTTSKKSGNPQVKLVLKIVEDGLAHDMDEAGNVTVRPLKGSKNRYIYKYYPLKDDTTVKRFVSDMLKFEVKEGEPALPAEAFTTAAVLSDSLAAIADMQIYVQISVSGEGENKTSWTNLISWKRAKEIELPM